MQIRTCALCAHCEIDLGSRDWSDVTPGEEGKVTCSKGHSEEAHKALNYGGLIELAKLAHRCPDFELMKMPVEP